MSQPTGTVARVIFARSYLFGVALWSTKASLSHRGQVGAIMKRILPGAAAATPCLFATWCSAICLAAFLTTISASAATEAQSSADELNPAEKWVVEQVSAGKIADLSEKFPDEEKEKRKLSAHFLDALLTGTLPGVKLHRLGVRIIGAIIDEPIELTDAEIRCRVWLAKCQFLSGVTFTRTNFGGVTTFDSSTFEAEVDFKEVKFGQGAFFYNAVFEGPVDFLAANVAGAFRADNARFKNKERGATFHCMKVGHAAIFRNAVFEGPVDFAAADIAREFAADEARFENRADFFRMKVGYDAAFYNAVFEGPVNFVSAYIVGNFEAVKAQFKNEKQSANFNSMKVGETAFFRNAVFEGTADFLLADIAGNFEAQDAQFRNKEQGAYFYGMKVGQIASFKNAVFEGRVEFDAADIAANFEAQRAKFQSKEKGAYFSSMKVGGHALFYGAVFEGPVDFSYANFGWLELLGASWPKGAGQLYMQGMSYKYVSAARGEPESHKALLTLADRSVYTADVYSNLEEFFVRQGYRGDADEAFTAGKRREREEYFRSGRWFSWLGSWMLDLLVGYGRRPWQAGIPCAALVALGCVLFSPKKMEPQKPEDTRRVYSRFWYSLGLFLPFVDLQADKVWKPKADQTFLRNYMRVHIILGWILVPLVLAALTGLIK
jgi:hypothetical protein